MALRIVTKKRFENKVKKLLEYLLLNWYDSVAEDFLYKLNHSIKLLSEQQKIVSRASALNGVRSILITKHNRLYYRIEKNTLIRVIPII